MRSIRFAIFSAIAATLCGAALPAQAPPAADKLEVASPTPTPAPDIHPDAERILRAMSDAYANAKAVRFEGRLHAELKGRRGDRVEDFDFEIVWQKPNRYFRAIRKAGALERTLTSDGKDITEFAAPQKLYQINRAPRNFEEFPQFDREGSSYFVWQLALGDPYHSIVHTLQHARPVGTEKIGDEEFDVVECEEHTRGGLVTFRLWIAKGGVPKLRRVASVQGGSGKFTIDFAKCEIEPALAEDFFAFKPPAGALKYTGAK